MNNLKSLFCCIVITLFSIESNGQISIQLTPSITHNFSSMDVWNMSVLYIGQAPVSVRFVGKISDEKGKPLVQLISTNILLQPGMQVYNKSNLQTMTLTYQNAYASNYEKTSGQLPPCHLQYCVYAECMETPTLCIQKLNPENKAVSCQTLDLQPPTPLLLASPEDESKIRINRPNFTWIPPMPIGHNPDLKYEMTLVKMNKKQSAEDAIIRNRPLYKEGGLGQTFMAFPVNLTELEVGEKYAWTVKAFLGDIFITQADVWEFEIQLKKDELHFVNLANAKQGTHNCGNVLNFIYTEKYVPSDLQYIIIDSKGKNVCQQCPSLKTTPGNNSFSLERSFGNMNKNELYTLVITNSKGKKNQLKFIYTE
jgi:hypothetical protein